MKNNVEVVAAAVTANGLGLEYASDDMKNNLEVVTAAVTGGEWSLEYASVL